MSGPPTPQQSPAAQNRTVQETPINEELELARRRAARALRDRSFLQGGIDKPPTFFKPYALLTKPQVMIKASLLLPVSLEPGEERNLTSFPIFDEPYNNIQNFTFDPMTRQMKLTFIDRTSEIADMLLFSFIEQGRRGASGGTGQIEIEFGWRRPDTYKVPKRVEDKTQWTLKRIFTLGQPEYKFLSGMSGVEITLTGTASSLSVIPGLEKAKPYFALGPFPLVELVKGLALGEMLPLATSLTESNIEALIAGRSNNANLKNLVELLQKRYGVTTDSEKNRYLRGLLNLVRGNRDQFERIRTLGATTRTSDVNSFYRKLQSTTIDFLADLESPGVGDPESRGSFSLEEEGERSEALEDFLKFIAPIIGEFKVHPMNAFIFCYEKMREQLSKLNPTLQPILTSFLKPDQIQGIRQTSNNTTLQGLAGLFNDDDAMEFVQVKNIQINSGTSWEALFDEILRKVNLKTGDAALRGKDPLRAGSHMIYVKNPESNVVIGADGNIEDNSESNIDDILKNIRLLAEVNNTTTDNASIEKANEYNRKIIDFVNSNNDDLLFTFIGPKDPGIIFANIGIENRVIQGYSYRPYVDRNAIIKEFWSGRLAVVDNNFPDVISFEPEFNFQDMAIAIVRNSQLGESVTLGSVRTYSDQEERQRNDPIQNADQVAQTFQDEYMSIRYPISTNMFQQASFLTVGGQETVDAQEAKNALQNLRTRLGLMSLNVKAKLTILGEPSMSETLTNSCYIFLKIINADGTESFLSGLWIIVKVLSHDIQGGQYTTTLEISKAKGNNVDDRLGYTNYVRNRDAQIIGPTSF